MILFHIVFDLSFFYDFKNIHFDQGFWFYVGRIAAIIFIILVGVNSSISFNKEKKINFKKFLKRAGRLIFFALLITLATGVFYRQGMVVFGILHFLSLSILLSIFFVRFKYVNLFLAAILFVIAPFLNLINPKTWILLPFGIAPYTFESLDYYPLFPWFGVVLIGIFIGNVLYPEPKSFLYNEKNKHLSVLEFIGKHSLSIYLLHQPIILAIFYFIISKP